MKKILLSALTIAAFSFAAVAQEKAPKPAPAPAAQPGNMGAFKWVETTHDFGKIPQGKPVTYEFKFTNVGTAPIVISQAPVAVAPRLITPRSLLLPVKPAV